MSRDQRLYWLYQCLLLGGVLFFLTACQPEKKPVRGVWLTNVVSDAMDSKGQIEKAVALIDHYGFNTIYVVTWNRGFTQYPSEVMEQFFGYRIDPQYEGRDPLQEVIDAASPRGIKVVAWFEFGFSCSYQEPDGGHILQKYPEMAAIDTAGRIVEKNGFQWMNGFDPKVQELVLSLLMEVTRNYEIAGIQGDDRLPAMPSSAGYDTLTILKYQADHNGQEPPKDLFDTDWIAWRVDILNQFMKTIHDELKQIRPDLLISVAPSIYPWSKKEYLQDWPTWVEEGWVDEVCPQIYRYDLEKYQLELDKIMNHQVAKTNHVKVVPGILLRVGDYYASDTFLSEMIKANRSYGIEGEVFFYFEGIKKRPDFFEELYSN